MIQVSKLAIYPVKSCAPILANHRHIDQFGLAFDRRWMVVDSNGNFITQRQYPRMCLVNAQLDNEQLTLSVDGMPALTVSTLLDKSVNVTVWGDRCLAQDCGDEAANWLSKFLQTDCRLVYFPADGFRQVDKDYANKGEGTAFADGFPLLLISQASMDDLNNRMVEPMDIMRFRPNLVVAGCDAYAEDNWERIRVGDLTMRIVKPCSRCVIPSINPLTAEKSAEPTKTLAEYRRRDNKIFFGQNVIVEGNGVIELGMPVEVLD